jgi:hypothetical protein
VLRYIHQNPVKAGLSKTAGEYEHSSYIEYIGKQRIIDKAFILDLFAQSKSEALKEFINYHGSENDDKCLDIVEDIPKTLSDKEIRQLLFEKYGLEPGTLHDQPTEVQNEILTYLKALQGSSLRQLSRLTGFTVNKIFRA